MPTIKGLTEHQVALLDEMWACDTFEEYETFLECLDTADREEAERLQRLLLVEMLDEDMLLKSNEDFKEANEVIDRFRL